MGITIRSAVAVAVVCLSGCSGADDGDSSCAVVVEYDGRAYFEIANVKFAAAERVGIGEIPSCDDGGEIDPPSKLAVLAVEGIDPSIAISLEGDSSLYSVKEGREYPPEVQDLIDSD